MHTDHAPDEITESYIEYVCDDLECALINVLDNEGAHEQYDNAVDQLKHIGAMLDSMIPDDGV